MCRACLAGDEIVIANLFNKRRNSWTLTQASKGYEDATFCWPQGWYGLTRRSRNEPAFVFPADGLCSDPLNDLTSTEMNALAKDDPRMSQARQHVNYVRMNKTRFKCDPKTGWALVKTCIAAGYRPDLDGDVEFWLIDFIARRLGK